MYLIQVWLRGGAAKTWRTSSLEKYNSPHVTPPFSE